MRLILLTVLTMIAFAANSVLNRLALAEGDMGPASFALIRLAAGAVVLLVLSGARGGRPVFHLVGAMSLALYVLGFSFAYVTLETGVGALILFGGVQITMFAGAIMLHEKVPLARWLGAGVAFAGLIWLLWPGGQAPVDPLGAGLMAAAALGWGIYSLIGRGAVDALGNTASNFLFALPAGLVVFALMPDTITLHGALLAILSGAVTSGLGYALWYSVLPRLDASVGAVAQLTVPMIAMAGGMLILAEPLSARFTVSALLVLGGVGLSLLWSKPR